MALNDNERLNKIDKKLEQLKAERKAVVAREKEKARKERTRRLIQNGALAEQYFQCNDISPEDFEILLKQIVSISEVKSLLTE